VRNGLAETFRPSTTSPVKSDVPVLMVSGEFDPATPPQFGRAAAESLPNSRQVVVPNIAHNYDSDCIRRVTAEFI
jgi:pimeloyl-ACP methyl ester carboxylesterase